MWPVGVGQLDSLKWVLPWELCTCPPQKAMALLLSLGSVRRYFLLSKASSQPSLVLPALWGLAQRPLRLSLDVLVQCLYQVHQPNFQKPHGGMREQCSKGRPDQRSLSELQEPHSRLLWGHWLRHCFPRLPSKKWSWRLALLAFPSTCAFHLGLGPRDGTHIWAPASLAFISFLFPESTEREGVSFPFLSSLLLLWPWTILS